MKQRWHRGMGLAAVGLLAAGTAQAFQFDAGPVKGSLDSTVTTGFGMRMKNADHDLIGDPTEGATQEGTWHWSNGDNGNLNYGKHDLFTAYLKGTHEVLLSLPAQFKLMARGTWLYDFAADNTDRTSLSSSAKEQVVHDVRLLDFWGSKQFAIGDQTARVRLGNQVVSWGESLFTPGGINATNALDIQKLLVPGTQLKEAVIPAPILSFATGLGAGFNMEAYYQFRWNESRLPPVGSYWSAADFLGNGKDMLYINLNNPNFGGQDAAAVSRQTGIGIKDVKQILSQPIFDGEGNFIANDIQLQYGTFAVPFTDDKEARNGGQYGISLHYKPAALNLDLGVYFLNYHDKTPNAEFVNGLPRFRYMEDRKVYGVSANFPVGDLAVGWELSYRPKDAIALTTTCFNPGGKFDAYSNTAPTGTCEAWKDNEKYQMALTGILSLTPGDYGWALNLLGADTATMMFEGVVIRYPGVSPSTKYKRTTKDNVPVVQGPSANLNFWQNEDPELGSITGTEGTEYSGGYTVDFNWVYDGKLIPGWQVIPGFTFTHAVFGDTPTAVPTYLHGNKALNLYLLFNQNPATWQAGLNYTMFFGDDMRQPYRDRNFLGGFVSYNF